MTGRDHHEINELLFRLLDNEISDEGLATLKAWLGSGPEAKGYYCRFMEDYSALVLRATTGIEEGTWPAEENILNEIFWSELSEEEKRSPGLPVCRAEVRPEREPVGKIRYERPAQAINKFSLAAAILCAAALVMMIVYVQVWEPRRVEMATVADAIDAEWSGWAAAEAGTRIAANTEPIRLTRGIVKLVTDHNVEVVLEAPTEFQFVSYSEIALSYGKLFARVSEQGYGFSVATPNSRIVDLGTEFGVLSHIDGNTEVYMYKGKANLFAGQKSENKTAELLTAGSARKVDSRFSEVRTISLEETAVVRQIDSRAGFVWKGQALSLADVVGGGSGFGGGRLMTGIDAATGGVKGQLANEDTVEGQAGCRAVVGNPYVDAVFVPGLEGGLTAITSDGSLAAQFPATSGCLWGYIFNGAMHQGMTTPRHALELDGQTWGTRDKPAITLHSNQGITFDLNAIRRTVPGLHIRSFRSLAGVSGTVQDALRREQGRSFEDFPEVEKVFAANGSKVECRVLVDGREVFSRVLSSAEACGRIEVPLTDRDRYLTIAVTESDDTHAYDWALLGRPELVLELTK